MLYVVALVVCLPAFAQPSRTVDYTWDVNGRRVEGASTTRDDGRSGLWVPGMNGRETPLERVQEKVISEGLDGKIVERTIQPYDQTGRPLPPRRVRVEERRNPDGTTTTRTAEYHGDINGHLGLWERTTTSTRKSGDTERSETVVERPGVNGGLEVSEKRESSVRTAGKNSLEDGTVYRRDANGNWIAAERRTAEKIEAATGEIVENRADYARGSDGLELAGQSVSRTRKGPGGAEVKEVDIFRPDVPGRSNDTGRPQLRERQLIETKSGPAGSKVETISVSRPSPSDPNKLSPFQKIGERVCEGDCSGK